MILPWRAGEENFPLQIISLPFDCATISDFHLFYVRPRVLLLRCRWCCLGWDIIDGVHEIVQFRSSSIKWRTKITRSNDQGLEIINSVVCDSNKCFNFSTEYQSIHTCIGKPWGPHHHIRKIYFIIFLRRSRFFP